VRPAWKCHDSSTCYTAGIVISNRHARCSRCLWVGRHDAVSNRPAARLIGDSHCSNEMTLRECAARSCRAVLLECDRAKDEFLIVFSVEAIDGSANATRQFLVAFPSASNWQASVVEVRRRGVREVLKLEADGRAVVLTTAERKDGDAMCCPSGPSSRSVGAVCKGHLIATLLLPGGVPKGNRAAWTDGQTTDALDAVSCTRQMSVQK
jgi:hypothetical protein